MGIATLVVAALKRVPWTTLAMNYGPEILKRLKEQIRPPEVDQEAQFIDAAGERIRELETLVAEQDKLVRQQQERIEQLHDACRTLEARARLMRIVSVAASAGVLLLLGILLSR